MQINCCFSCRHLLLHTPVISYPEWSINMCTLQQKPWQGTLTHHSQVNIGQSCYFIGGLFKDAVSNSDYIAMND
jgi:hypothetical protein